MSCTIRRVYMVELEARGFGKTRLWAETLEALDAELEAYLSKLSEAREARARVILARLAGAQRRAYKDARALLTSEDGAST